MSGVVIEGWCTTCKADVPADTGRRCTACGDILIPPSYGSREQVWGAGFWHPHVARPAGYTYAPPKYLAAPPAHVARPTRQDGGLAPRTTAAGKRRRTMAETGRVCATCGRGDRRATNGPDCERCTNRKRIAAARSGANVPRPCRHCGTVYTPVPPPQGGPASLYCNPGCRAEAKNARKVAARAAA